MACIVSCVRAKETDIRSALRVHVAREGWWKLSGSQSPVQHTSLVTIRSLLTTNFTDIPATAFRNHGVNRVDHKVRKRPNPDDSVQMLVKAIERTNYSFGIYGNSDKLVGTIICHSNWTQNSPIFHESNQLKYVILIMNLIECSCHKIRVFCNVIRSTHADGSRVSKALSDVCLSVCLFVCLSAR